MGGRATSDTLGFFALKTGKVNGPESVRGGSLGERGWEMGASKPATRSERAGRRPAPTRTLHTGRVGEAPGLGTRALAQSVESRKSRFPPAQNINPEPGTRNPEQKDLNRARAREPQRGTARNSSTTDSSSPASTVPINTDRITRAPRRTTAVLATTDSLMTAPASTRAPGPM